MLKKKTYKIFKTMKKNNTYNDDNFVNTILKIILEKQKKLHNDINITLNSPEVLKVRSSILTYLYDSGYIDYNYFSENKIKIRNSLNKIFELTSN